MSQPLADPPRQLPPWAVPVGSAFIIFHFLAVGSVVLAASSGPWATNTRFGDSPALGPAFAGKINDLVRPIYLEPLRLTHDYHFASNRLLISSVYFEARLKNAQGNEIKTLKFPGNANNFWQAHRYKQLALGLGDDQPVQPPRGEQIAAPGKKVEQVIIWDNSDPKLWKLSEVPEHLVSKDRPVMRPSDWSLLLARAYQRYLLRQHDAASVEIIRHNRDPVLPGFMFGGAPEGTFDELVCSFGEYRRDK
jgi:hypothetical protein